MMKMLKMRINDENDNLMRGCDSKLPRGSWFPNYQHNPMMIMTMRRSTMMMMRRRRMMMMMVMVMVMLMMVMLMFF